MHNFEITYEYYCDSMQTNIHPCATATVPVLMYWFINLCIYIYTYYQDILQDVLTFQFTMSRYQMYPDLQWQGTCLDRLLSLCKRGGLSRHVALYWHITYVASCTRQPKRTVAPVPSTLCIVTRSTIQAWGWVAWVQAVLTVSASEAVVALTVVWVHLIYAGTVIQAGAENMRTWMHCVLRWFGMCVCYQLSEFMLPVKVPMDWRSSCYMSALC